MARRLVRGPSRPSMRRGTSWARLQLDDFVTVPPASKALVATLVLANPGITETVIRSIGTYMVIGDSSAAELQTGALGFIVVNDLAIAAGAASIPGPVTDASDDGWFVWEPFLSFSQNTTATGAQQTRVFESKGARRIEEGFTVAVMVENAHATFGLDFIFGASFLTKVNT